MNQHQLLVGDVHTQLATLDDNTVDCVVTSPPYWGLRDYGTGEWEGGDEDCDHKGPPKASDSSGLKNDGRPPERVGQNEYEREATVPYRNVCGKCGATRTDRQIGLEPTPDEFVARIVEVFREVRRVLAPHGTCWVNIGDSYNANQGAGFNGQVHQEHANRHTVMKRPPGIKPKDLVGQPWRVAFGLQADGWYLRSDIIWAKPNPMPESVTDRPTKAHEYVFLLTKRPRYFYDADAVRETAIRAGDIPGGTHRGIGEFGVKPGWGNGEVPAGRNLRTVWTIPTHPYPEAHFATYPPALVEKCVKAGCPRRVCRTCGKPQERIVDVSYEFTQAVHNRTKHQGHQTFGDRSATMGVPANKVSQTTGFTDCGHNDYRPGVVLDPFLGSGTTSVVALRNHLDAIGIELNPEYAKLAEKRLARWWDEPTTSRDEPIDGQLTLT